MTLNGKTHDRFIEGPVPIAVLFIEHPSRTGELIHLEI